MTLEVETLRSELLDARKGLEEQKAGLEEQLRMAAAQVEEVDKALQDLNRAARSTDAEFGLKLERLVREVQELRGATELADFRLGKHTAILEGAQPLAERVRALEEQIARAQAARDQAAAKAATAAEETPAAMLEKAKARQEAGELVEARGAYREVIQRWPHELGVTDQAIFRLGETYFDERRFPAAVQEYIQIIEKFADGEWVDDAYFKIGLASVHQGDLEDAQIFFKEVVNRHKDSPLRPKAEARLSEVEKLLAKEKSSKKKPEKRSRKN